MRFEQRLRDGLEDGSVLGQQIGTFEKYTKVRQEIGVCFDFTNRKKMADFEGPLKKLKC